MKNMTVVLISFGLNIVGRVTSAYILYPFAKDFAVYFANPFSVLVGSLTVFFFYMLYADGEKIPPNNPGKCNCVGWK
jgi:hypothetical protein